MPKGDGNRHSFEYNGMNTDLAYLIGVYMGDGYCDIREGKYGTFRVAVVDTDFLVEVQKTAECALGFRSEIKFDRKAANANSRDRYVINICCSQFAIWLTQITGKKSFVSDEIVNASREVKLAFVQGLMDSEATIINRRITDKNRVTGSSRVVFGVKSDWINTVHRICKDLGTKPSNIYTNGGIYKFAMSPMNYSTAGLTFSIERKRLILAQVTAYRPDKKPEYLRPRKKSTKHRGKSRLSDQDVIEIMGMIDKFPTSEIAGKFGVDSTTVRRIARKITFKDLTLP